MEHTDRDRRIHRGAGHPPADRRRVRRPPRSVPRRTGRRPDRHDPAGRQERPRERLRQPDHLYPRGPPDAGVRRRSVDRVAYRRVRRGEGRSDPDRPRSRDHHRSRQPRAGPHPAERPLHHGRDRALRRGHADRRDARRRVTYEGGGDRPLPAPDVPELRDRDPRHERGRAAHVRWTEPGRVRRDPAPRRSARVRTRAGPRGRPDAERSAPRREGGVGGPPARPAHEPGASASGTEPHRPRTGDRPPGHPADRPDLRGRRRRAPRPRPTGRADRPDARLHRARGRELVGPARGRPRGPRRRPRWITTPPRRGSHRSRRQSGRGSTSRPARRRPSITSI